MTILQASERFGVALDKLEFYEKQGLFDCHKQPDGSIDYCDELMDYVGIINVLMESGADLESLRVFMHRLMQSTITKEEKLRFLRQQRRNLLDSIHSKQKSLDHLDYLIYEISQISAPDSAT